MDLLESFGKLAGQPHSLDVFFLKIYKYDADAEAVSATDRGAAFSKAVNAVLREAALASVHRR